MKAVKKLRDLTILAIACLFFAIGLFITFAEDIIKSKCEGSE